MGDLSGKVAIVTGTGRMRGIGRAIALRLAEDGAAVAVTAVARSPESFPGHEREAGWRGVKSVAQEIRQAGGKTLALDVDVTKPVQVGDMVERTKAEFARIDILVNNHGLALLSGKKDLWQVDDEEWLRGIAVNLHGLFHTCKAVAPVLISQGVRMFVPLGRQGAPREIAGVVAYLASDKARRRHSERDGASKLDNISSRRNLAAWGGREAISRSNAWTLNRSSTTRRITSPRSRSTGRSG